MAKYIVEQSGPLRGEVSISGAKNAVLPLMAATLLSDEECIIDAVPHLADVNLMKEILSSLGSEIEENGENTISVRTEDILSTELQKDLVSRMRASILVMGPLLARKGRGILIIKLRGTRFALGRNVTKNIEAIEEYERQQ